MRWRQVVDKTTGLSEFVPIDEAAAKRDHSEHAAIHGPMAPFVSPIDGTVIHGRKSYREHCERHGVVPAAEFSPEYLAGKRKERDDFYQGKISKKERLERRQNIYEIWTERERNG